MTAAISLRDAIYAKLATYGEYTTRRKVPVPQLQVEQLPALSIFILTGRDTPDGDGNAGPIALVNEDTIAISVARGFEDPVSLEGALHTELDDIKTRLLTDADFTKMGSGALFEAITAVNRRWVFPQQGEAYFAEMRIEITFVTREVFEPVVDDDLDGITLKGRPILNPNAPLIERHILEKDEP